MICGKSELCIFDRPSPQAVIEFGAFEEVFPMNSITDSRNDIEFYINGSQTEYLDLNDTLLTVQIKVVDKDRKVLDANADVIPNNFLFHTLFKDAVLGFNNIKIEGGNNTFIHKALIETILNYNSDTKNTCLTPMGYAAADDERKKWVKGSKVFTMCSSLQLDFMDQPKYLLPGVNVHIRLKRSDSALSLTSATTTPICQLVDAKLLVRRVRVDPSVLAGHQLGLNSKHAIYPLKTKEIVQFAIAKGASSFYKEQIFGDRRMPNFILVTFQSETQYNGSYTASSSIFKNFGVTSLTLSKNTDYRETYTQDFESDNYCATYMQSIVRNLGYLDKNLNCGITLEEFKSKYPFFTFVLAPDFDLNQSQLPQNGNLRLDIKFAKAITERVHVIIYGVFENEVQITANRTVLV